MAPNSVSIGSLSREIDNLKSQNRALIGLILDLQRTTYSNARALNATPEALTILEQNAAILKRLLDGKP
jgi:hypothetical protein